jgi:hypothetical protein
VGIRIGEEAHIKEGLKIERYDAKRNALVAYLGNPYNKPSDELGDQPYDLFKAEKEVRQKFLGQINESEEPSALLLLTPPKEEGDGNHSSNEEEWKNIKKEWPGIEEAREFLLFLFKEKFEGEFIEVRGIREEDRPRQKFFKDIEEALNGISQWNEQKFNCYVGAATRIKEEGSKDAIKHVIALWAEVDSKDYGSSMERAWEKVKASPIKPSYIICSGHGYHLYWKLDMPYEANRASDVNRIETVLKAIAEKLGGDLQVAELARVMRVPGTLNFKEEKIVECHSIYSGNERYSLEAFNPIMEGFIQRQIENRVRRQRNYPGDGSIVEEIKSHNPLLEVCEEYGLGFKKVGKQWQALCCFHDEHNPSLTVWDDGGWWCFGCGRGGDVISFVMEREKIGFKEALEKLAQRGGIEVPHPIKRKQREVGFFATDTEIWEEVYQDGKVKFAYLSHPEGQIEYVDKIESGNEELLPISADNEAILKEAVIFPSQAEEYERLEDLKVRIQQHIKKYFDISVEDETFCVHYILLTWVYDKFSTIPYLGFRGDFGTGKSRGIEVIGGLCYKPCKIAGAITPAPIYRLVGEFKGTLIIEEANLRDSTEANEIVKILNCGFEKKNPIIRCNKDNPSNLQFFDPFCPKVVTTRGAFDDKALESRFYTIILKGSDRVEEEEIPYVLGEEFREGQEHLRNKLLLFRLRSYFNVSDKDIEKMSLPKIEPRLKQAFSPFIILLQNYPEELYELEKFLQSYNRRLVEERTDSLDGRIVERIFEISEKEGNDYISSGEILRELDLGGEKVYAQTIGKKLNALGIKTSNPRLKPGTDNKKKRYIVWDEKLMKRLKAKYIPEG